MDIDVMDTVQKADEARRSEQASQRLNMLVAITVAILSTFTGICKVKDDNIVQAMQQAQANKLDHWAFYQARNVREEVAKATLLQLQLSSGASAADHARYQPAIAEYEKLVAEQHRKKEELQALAEQDQKDYDAANFRDDQFDLSDALIAIAIALLAVTALTQQRWLYVAALVPTAFGVLMGLAGLCGWPLHPSALIQLLS